MDNLERYCRAVDRLNRAERRARFRQELADGLRVIAAAKAAGFQVKGATIAGVALELGATAASATAEQLPSVALFRTRANPKQKVML
jgi:uncharacterized protein YgbK (DUF1537 family)